MSSFEIAGSYKLSANADLLFKYFYNSLTEIHGVDPARLRLNPPRTVFVSAGRIDFTGFEAAAVMKFKSDALFCVVHQHVQLGSKVNDVFGILTSPDRKHIIPYPEEVTKLLLDLPIHQGIRLDANANMVWRQFGLRSAGRFENTGFYGLLNANLVFRLTSRTQLIFSGYNLTNEDQEVPLTLQLFNVPAERNFNLGLYHRF